MNRTFRALFLVGALLFKATFPSLADDPSPPAPPSAEHVEKSALPGVAAAEAISTVTGIAISPLLGLGSVGAWKYFRTPAEMRSRLPWFAQPWCWLPAVLLVSICFLKDTAGAALPSALKKPLDVAELFENKLSGLIATGAIIPLILTITHSFETPTSPLAGGGLASADWTSLLKFLAVPIGLFAYAVVFLASHALNVLILLSPFSAVDTALKSLRLFLLSTVVGTSMLHSTLGAVWALCILALCLLVAGWAFRLSVFGHIFAWDLLTFRSRRISPNAFPIPAFLSHPSHNTPARTYGKVTRDDSGALHFQYRPWLIFPTRSFPLSEAPTQHFVGRGLIHPTLFTETSGEPNELCQFPPRFSSHESRIAELTQASSVRDVGIRAAWTWIRSLFGAQPRPALPISA